MKTQLKFEKGIDELISMVQYAKKQHEDAIRLNELLQNMILTAGGHLWKKDLDGKYEYCDPSWCEIFFKLPRDCNILGFTDDEILTDFRAEGKKHTYGEVCLATDKHCIHQKKKSHYIEMGWVEEDLLVIDVIKTPIFKNGKITGTIGFAKDLSSDPVWICNEIDAALKTKESEIVFKQGDDVAAYHVFRANNNNQCKTLKHFPST